MNPTSADPTAPPPPQPQPPRSSFSCDRHPEEQFTGFCPACLCERLTTLDQSSANTPSSSRRPSSAAAAAIKSLFSSSTTASKPSNLPPPPAPLPKPLRPVSFLPELRRTKSFSASKNEGLGLFIEPQRKSCDVRARNTLSSLFTLDNDNKSDASCHRPSIVVSASSSSHQNPQNSKRIESSGANKPVLKEKENVGDSRDTGNAGVVDGVSDDRGDGNGYEIRPVRDSNVQNLGNSGKNEANSGEIVEEKQEEEVVTAANLKPMKDHIDGDSRDKKSTGGGFWSAASVFSKKWHKWRRTQKMKKQNSGVDLATLPEEKPIPRQYRETQSEIADYGFGRRSCDTDPRFSLDAVRISFDDPRYSFEEPRASWDGHLLGKSFPRMAPMVSVMEDAPAVHISRSDMQIPVEEPTNEIDGVPGGTSQTREYYSDSSSRRRKSLDRSSSIRKSASSVVAEIDELKTVTNAKVSSATAADSFHGSKAIVGEKNLGDSNLHSLRDECSETIDLASRFRDGGNSVVGNGEKKESKKLKKWGWRIWEFIQRRNGGNKDNEDEKYSRVNGVERSLSESWKDSRSVGSGDVRGAFNRNKFRSNSSVSWRNANSFGRAFGGSMRKPAVEMNGHGKKRKDEFVLEKTRSARYSPNHVDNGLLRLYLTPMRSSQKAGLGKIKANNSISRSMLRLY